MNKTLNTLQVFSKIGKILSTIALVFCIVGVVFCIIALSLIGAVDKFPLNVNGLTIHSLFEQVSGSGFASPVIPVVLALIVCLAQGIVCKFAQLYFKHELAAGTPFTFEGAKELLRLGIISAASSIGSSIAGAVAVGIIAHYAGTPDSYRFSLDSSLNFAIACIVVSFILKYGAECRSKTSENTAI